MSKAAQPELKKVPSPSLSSCLPPPPLPLSLTTTRPQYMDKRLFINLQGNRKISGVLRGFDIFLNLVLDESREEGLEGGERRPMGTVVRPCFPFCSLMRSELMSGGRHAQVIRGSSVNSLETLGG